MNVRQMQEATATVAAPEDDLRFQDLILIAGGHVAFQLLWAGHELGLFSLLSKEPGLTRGEIAAKLSLQPQPARILLVGLTALKLIRKADERFSNAALTDKMLVGERPGSPAPILGWQAHIVYPGLTDFVEALRQNRNVGLERFAGTGETLYQRLAGNAALETVFQDAMSALSQQANAHLLEILELGAHQHLVDVGGGDGTNAIAIARKFPQLRATVLDSPTVCRRAEQNFAASGLAERLGTCPGDIFETPFPTGIDCILFAHIFTIWSREENARLLAKCHAALPPRGQVLIFNMMAADDDSGPLSTALGSPYFLAIATGKGMLYAWKDYETLLRQCGFSKIERVSGLPLDHGLMIATK